MAEHSPSPSSALQDGSHGIEPLDNLVLQAPEPMREDYIQNAVKFLSHPNVKGSAVFHRRSFLEKKGLAKEELDEAFRRVPDPQPNSANAAPVVTQEGSLNTTNCSVVVDLPENYANQPAMVQPYTSVQSPQTATGSVIAGPIVPHTKPQFSWVNALLGAGLFLGFGASAAITIKKLFVPRLKSWTRRVVAEGDENAKDELNSKIYEDIKEVSTSALSEIARTNQEVLASKDEDMKILMKLAEAFDSQADVFKSLNETLTHIRESRFSQYNRFEEHVQPAPWNGPLDIQWRASQANMYTASPSSGFDSGRHSFTPLPPEPTYGSFSGSYTEFQQRVQMPGHGGFQPQMINDRSSPRARSSYYGAPPYQHSGNAIDPAPAPAVTLPPESPFRRHWVPPQPPGVIMPEAAAAIRQPRSLPRQQPGDGRPGTDAPRRPESAMRGEQTDGASRASGGGLPSDGGGEREQQMLPEAA